MASDHIQSRANKMFDNWESMDHAQELLREGEKLFMDKAKTAACQCG